MPNKLALEIEKLLSESVGDFIARATVKKNCEMIGTSADTLTPDQLPDLAEKISKSISFFSGQEAGSELAEKIKKIKV